MKVKLLAMTNNAIDIIYAAAKTCYSKKSPIEIFEDDSKAIEKKLEFIEKIVTSGHHSVLEHINVTFAIEGISRACSHQLVRHRFCSFSQQSQRYVGIKEDEENLRELLDTATFDDENEAIKACVELQEIANKYFVDVTPGNTYRYAQSLLAYLEQIKAGNKPEDARNLLPNGTKTNLVITCNLRELIHICGLRLCTRAQKEIRTLIKEMSRQVIEQNEWLKYALQAKCKQVGFCTEEKCCGLMPKVNALTESK